MGTLLLAFASILLVIIGFEEPSDNVYEKINSALPYIGIFVNPILLATGAIAMRKMRKMPEAVVSSYVNTGLFIVSGILIAVVKTPDRTSYQGFTFWKDFDSLTWFLIPCNGISTVITQTTKFAAYKR